MCVLCLVCCLRYITKPAPIYPPATLDQLLAQEKAAAVKALPAPDQQQQRSASCPPENIKQQQQQPEVKDEQQQPAIKQEQVDTQQVQQAQQDHQQQQHQYDLPVLQDVLSSRPRCAYGYSLAGRGLLQLIRGLPPYPDWVSAVSVCVAVTSTLSECMICTSAVGSCMRTTELKHCAGQKVISTMLHVM